MPIQLNMQKNFAQIRVHKRRPIERAGSAHYHICISSIVLKKKSDIT